MEGNRISRGSGIPSSTQDIVRIVYKARQGLGSESTIMWKGAKPKDMQEAAGDKEERGRGQICESSGDDKPKSLDEVGD